MFGKFGKFDNSITESMARGFGFQNVQNTEKFILNFHVHEILSAEMDCCLRGGLCTPFYATDPKAKRVSIDLDLFVEDTREAAISKVVSTLKGRNMKIVPRKPRKVNNLLQLDLRYGTTRLLHDEKDHMRIDVMHSVDFDPPMKSFPRGHSIFTGKVGYDVTALTPGCLASDKIAALAINGTGYTKVEKAPKQIHDIGYLLDELTPEDLAESFDVFREITEFKTRGAENGSAPEVIQHVIGFLSGLVTSNGGIGLSQKYKSDFDTFRENYLSAHVDYSPEDLKRNVLKTLLYASCAKKAIMGEIDAKDAAKIAHGGINGTADPIKDVRRELKTKTFLVGDRPSAFVKGALDNEPDSVLRVLYGMSNLG